MSKRKTLQELTIKDDFMFGAVMCEEENCKGFLEMVLGFPIERRSRYYHSQIVMEALDRGVYYDELTDTFVIFLCDYDPFGEERYCYTFRNVCKEDPALELKDGSCTIFLSTKGKNEAEVPPEMVRFLKFVTAELVESEADFEDALVQKLQKTIRRVKTSREMGGRYMTFEELLREENEDGMLKAKREAVLELLEDFGEIPEELQNRIKKLEDMEALKILLKLAARADSLRAFEEASKVYFSSNDKE